MGRRRCTCSILFLSLTVPPLLSLLLFYFLAHMPLPIPPSSLQQKNILLLIAHPDDEAMFFSPSLLSLTSPALHNSLSILCLSSGDADGLGQIRKTELLASAKTLGILDDHAVTVIESPELPDSMEKTWNASIIADVMSELEMARRAEVVLTFDEGGVSGHPNHISLLEGAREFIARVQQREKRELGLWKLKTVGIVRKYAGVLDAAWTWFLVGGRQGKEGEGRAVFVSDWKGVRTAQRAMTDAHVSQMRWFRWGWIGLSRYMVVNELREDGERW